MSYILLVSPIDKIGRKTDLFTFWYEASGVSGGVAVYPWKLRSFAQGGRWCSLTSTSTSTSRWSSLTHSKANLFLALLGWPASAKKRWKRETGVPAFKKGTQGLLMTIVLKCHGRSHCRRWCWWKKCYWRWKLWFSNILFSDKDICGTPFWRSVTSLLARSSHTAENSANITAGWYYNSYAWKVFHNTTANIRIFINITTCHDSYLWKYNKKPLAMINLSHRWNKPIPPFLYVTLW